MDILSLLQSHPLFKTFSPEALAEAVRAGTAVTYEPGDICISQDQAGKIFGVLISGRLEAVQAHGATQREHLGNIESGECFGEMSLLTGKASSTEVIATTKSQAVVFLQEAISPVIALNPDAVKHLAGLITSRLAPSQDKEHKKPVSAARYSLGASEAMRILTIACRKDDVRYCCFDTTSTEAIAWGKITGLGTDKALHIYEGPSARRESRLSTSTHEAAVEAVFDLLTSAEMELLGSPADLSAVGHRISHGGLRFPGPAVIDEDVMKEIARLDDLAPLDNRYNLTGIEACRKLAPQATHVAVFDTSFHHGMPPAEYRYALPADLADENHLRRFGFHGISHEGAGRAVADHLGVGFDALRTISCHLGMAASLTAIDHGRSVANTMGLTALAGLVMARRPGDLDPGLVLHLLRDGKITPDELTRRLYTESGLLGLSGISDDAREILNAANDGDSRALLALQVYCRQARKYLSAYIGLLGGVEAIAFTGGIGRYCPGVRARICQGLDWMGISLDEQRNRDTDPKPGEVVEISQPQSRARIFVVGSNEQQTIARKTVQTLSQKRVTDVMRSKKRAIPIGVSAHHVHLTQPHVEALFGPGSTLTLYADLSQPGQFACKEQVALIGPKSRIERVRVLGPVRPASQVEISRTEEFKLGIDAPLRLSGDLDGTPGITLEGPHGQVVLDHGVICAMRHIHMSPQDAMEFAVRDHDMVRIRVHGRRSLIFGDVAIRVHPDFRLDMHIDTDEANAAELDKDTTGCLDAIQQRASG